MLDFRLAIDTPDGPTVLTGTAPTDGAVHVKVDVPEGTLRRLAATMTVPMGRDDRAFFNGFQSWSHCPEYRTTDRIPSLKRLPNALVRKFGLDRYGDYYFVDYPDKPGRLHGISYCYFRSGETYRLIASLDETMGYTRFDYDADTGILTIQRDCRWLRCSGTLSAFDLYFATGGEDEVFDGWFAAMGIQPRTKAPLAGYTSWYNRYQNIDAKAILTDLTGCAKILEPGDLFQIDDGWEPYIGDWLEPDAAKFPE
ncbi:MAG: alpha-galactosidase, partial [Oscillospiraceae bacterium]|nr:alpha-galactosidase [Oscillospiraceae bacterium]